MSRKATGLRSICRLHYQVSVLVFPFSLSPRSGFCTGKLESIRVVYGKSRICYQGYVQATQLLSGSCTDKRGFIKVLYGQDELCSMAPGCGIYCGTIYYGTFYCGTIYYGTIYYGTIAFDLSPSVIFIVSKSYCIPLIY